VAGDVFNTANSLTMLPRGIRLPFDFFTPDPARNRQSARRLGELEPKLLLVGHGPPLRDTKQIVEFCAAL
jgi:hydroxyacylglutathione hydrolase